MLGSLFRQSRNVASIGLLDLALCVLLPTDIGWRAETAASLATSAFKLWRPVVRKELSNKSKLFRRAGGPLR
jgi:hypothetical protein